MKIRYYTPFEDFNYERWTKAHRLTATVEPHEEGGFILTVEGDPKDVDTFQMECGLKPFQVEH